MQAETTATSARRAQVIPPPIQLGGHHREEYDDPMPILLALLRWFPKRRKHHCEHGIARCTREQPCEGCWLDTQL